MLKPRKRDPVIHAEGFPDLDLLNQLRIHREMYHGGSENNLVFCTECARLEGELELLCRFLETPSASERIA